MYPEVRFYTDPYEGLVTQLTELRGLIKVVPPLIDSDRQKRWDEINSRPGDGDAETIDVYENEAGAEEGWGFARFDRTIFVAAITTAWEVFREFLIRQLKTSFLGFDLSQHRPLAILMEKEMREWDRRFDLVVKRYEDFAGIPVATLGSWDGVLHAHELRNALTHNLGQYTSKYLKTKLAHRPTGEFAQAVTDEELVNREPIPLDYDLVDQLLRQLIAAALEVRDEVAKLS